MCAVTNVHSYTRLRYVNSKLKTKTKLRTRLTRQTWMTTFEIYAKDFAAVRSQIISNFSIPRLNEDTLLKLNKLLCALWLVQNMFTIFKELFKSTFRVFILLMKYKPFFFYLHSEEAWGIWKQLQKHTLISCFSTAFLVLKGKMFSIYV